MSLTKVTTNITYKVPDWEFCNIQGSILGRPSKERCRFCIKEGSQHRCALYNMPLDVTEGVLAQKAPQCLRASAGLSSIVSDEPEVQVDPKLIIKTTIHEYEKLRKKLVAQGYPEAIAIKVAQEALIGGK